MDTITLIAERRIAEALERGELDDLPGRGQKMVLEDESRIPEDFRMAYKVLKNAGYAPPEVTIRQEIANTRRMLADMTDEQEKYAAVKKLNFLMLKLNVGRTCPVVLPENDEYYTKVVDKISSDNPKS